MGPFAKALRYLRRELLARRLPHGLLSWRYLVPRRDARLRAHFELWWQAPRRLPRPIWLLCELWLWLRWTTFSAWRATWHMVRRLGPEVRAREGLPLRLQAWRTLRLSLGWCIPPAEVYRYRLYRQPAAALDYVYDHETPAYHRRRSAPLGLRARSAARLQDKLALAEELAAAGLPMVPTLACVRRGSRATLDAWLHPQTAVFCKTRSGNRGIGAFAAWVTADGPRGETFDGAALPTAEAVERAWCDLLALDDALVQPRLQNHAALQSLGATDDAITVRFISQWVDARPRCLSATLEVPAGRQERTGRPTYVILPIEPSSGRLLPCPADALPTAASRRRALLVSSKLGEAAAVPDWASIEESSYRGHRRFPDVGAVAWDWVVTPQGPRLLEGNPGWGVAMPQILHGGLLAGWRADAPGPGQTGLPCSSR